MTDEKTLLFLSPGTAQIPETQINQTVIEMKILRNPSQLPGTVELE
jgi:hypothetical protein